MKVISKISYISLLFFAIVLTFSCIFQIIGVTQEKYLSQEYQEKINTISRESYFAFRGVENGPSLKEVEEMAREDNFIDVENIIYVKAPATEVVVR